MRERFKLARARSPLLPQPNARQRQNTSPKIASAIHAMTGKRADLCQAQVAPRRCRDLFLKESENAIVSRNLDRPVNVRITTTFCMRRRPCALQLSARTMGRLSRTE